MPYWRKCTSGLTCGDIRIGRKICAGVEAGRGIAPLDPAMLVIVLERVDVGRRDVRIGRQIAAGIEKRVRIAPVVPAIAVEVIAHVDVRGEGEPSSK